MTDENDAWNYYSSAMMTMLWFSVSLIHVSKMKTVCKPNDNIIGARTTFVLNFVIKMQIIHQRITSRTTTAGDTSSTFLSSTTTPYKTNGNGSTDIQDLRSSPTGFHLRSSTGSSFTKEYSYSPDNREIRKTFTPRSHGFSYGRTSSPATTPKSPDSPSTGKTFESALKTSSTSPKSRATGVAFTYKPPTTEDFLKSSPTTDSLTRSPGQLPKVSPVTAYPRSSTLSKIDEIAEARRAFLNQPYSPATSDRGSSRLSYDSKATSSPRLVSVTAKTLPSPSQKPKTTPLSGRASRQSRESNLDSTSSSSVSSDSDSMVDEYEKDDARHDAIQTTSKISPTTPAPTTFTPFSRPTYTPYQSKQAARSNFFSSEKPVVTAPKPKVIPTTTQITSTTTTSPTSATTRPWVGYRVDRSDISRKSPEEERKSQSLPRFHHMSRKRVVTNADGSIEETEEVLDPTKLTSVFASKPVVVGVVPTTNISPKYDTVRFTFDFA